VEHLETGYSNGMLASFIGPAVIMQNPPFEDHRIIVCMSNVVNLSDRSGKGRVIGVIISPFYLLTVNVDTIN
jgi:hypothetical protein